MLIEVKIPALGESISEVTISRWMKKSGERVEMDEVLCEVETDKATMELNAEAAGVLNILTEEGKTLVIGDLICTLDTEGASVAAPTTVTPPTEQNLALASAPASQATYAAGHPSPAAGKILAEKGIDPAVVNGSGRDGRITKSDAENAKAPALAASAPVTSSASAPASDATPSGSRGSRREKMTTLRKTISRRLVAVKNETAMLTTFNEVNMGPVMELRSKYKDKFKEKHSIGLGFMSFFTKAVSIALKEWPSVNAMINGDEIVYNDFCDISIAVSAPKGLVVPVIRNAERMSLADIEREVSALAKKARENKLTLDEMTGGTFTITNGGVFGSMLSTPIINAPQSAILGMHNIVERPIALNGEVVIRPVMYVALSYDHRIIDGKESVSFLYRIKELLEDPARMLLDV